MFAGICAYIYKDLSLPLTASSSLGWGGSFAALLTLFISHWQKLFIVFSLMCQINHHDHHYSASAVESHRTKQENEESIFIPSYLM